MKGVRTREKSYRVLGIGYLEGVGFLNELKKTFLYEPFTHGKDISSVEGMG